jgi:hypothetical protein
MPCQSYDYDQMSQVEDDPGAWWELPEYTIPSELPGLPGLPPGEQPPPGGLPQLPTGLVTEEQARAREEKAYAAGEASERATVYKTAAVTAAISAVVGITIGRLLGS